VETALAGGAKTPDLGGESHTEDMTRAVIRALGE